MSKTPFSKKCDILGSLWLFYREDMEKSETWNEFLTWSDVGLPMSYLVSQNLVTLNGEEAETYVNDAWDVFCEMISIDSNDEYADLADCFAKSPNAPLENNEG